MVTEVQHGEWTISTLHELLDERFRGVEKNSQERDLRFEQRFQAQNKAVEAAFAAQQALVQAALAAAEKAVTKAEIAAEKRFDSVNEFRGQLKDQTATFIPRLEAVALIDNLSARVKKTEDIQSLNVGAGNQADKERQKNMWLLTTGIAITALVLEIISRV